MATGSHNLTTWAAKRIIGDNSATVSTDALLQITNNNSWILINNRVSTYGILYVYDNSTAHDKIEIYGGYQESNTDTPTAWIQLDTGDLYILGKVGIGYDPETSGNTYKLYVNGTSCYTGTMHLDNGSANWSTPSAFEIMCATKLFQIVPSQSGESVDIGFNQLNYDGAGMSFCASSNSSNPGQFVIFASEDSSHSYTLTGDSDGDLTWTGDWIVDGKSTLTGNVGIGASYSNDYKLYVDGTSYFDGIITSNSTLHLVPATGEGGQINLFASTENTTQAGIALDQYNSTFRIFGIASADGTTKTGTGTPLIIDPYAETITGGYTITGDLSGTATIATILSTTGDSGFISDQHGNFKHKRATNTDYWQLQDNTGATKFSVYWETGAITTTGTITHTASGVSYISGAAGNSAAIYAKKAAGSVWRPAITLQTSGSGSWQIGNYNDETLEFQYATAANISSQNNSTSEIYMQNGDTGRVMTSGNYNNWCPSNTGTGASGTWGINITGRAYSLKDRTNDNTSYLNYGAAGLAASAITWLCCWNGYEVRAISKAEMANATDSAHKWVRLAGDTMTGALTCSSGIVCNHGVNFMVGSNEVNFIPDSYNNTFWWNYETYNRKNNGNVTQYLFGNGKHAWNTTHIYAGAVHNAVWNDFAEFRESNITEPGRVLISNGYGQMILCQTRLAAGAKIISDTYGCSVGESDKAKTPLGVAGRVLAYTYQDRNNFKPGDAVCAAPNGTIDIMTREEIKEYPDRIIGIVDEIPNYPRWEQYHTCYKDNTNSSTTKVADIKVNGRIWIYVR